MQVGGKKKKLCVEDSRMEKVIYSSSMGDITFTFSMLPKPLDIPIINDNINNIPNQGNLQSKKKHVRYHFSELIDISLLKQLFDTFYKLTGIKYAIHDEDNNVLTRNGTADICYKFHRFCPRTKQRCEQSDRYLSEIFQDNSNYLQDNIYVSYKCLNGLMEYATPIVVEGQHLGTIFMGQVLNEPPDEDFFRRQAREFGFNEALFSSADIKITVGA
jgi:ligand-binding sensor protein